MLRLAGAVRTVVPLFYDRDACWGSRAGRQTLIYVLLSSHWWTCWSYSVESYVRSETRSALSVDNLARRPSMERGCFSSPTVVKILMNSVGGV